MLLILLLIQYLTTICLFIWSLYSPAFAGYTFTTIVIILTSYFLIIDYNGRQNEFINLHWTPEEIIILKKYHLSLVYPSASRDFSCVLNNFRWLSIIWIPLLLWNQIWTPSAILFINFLFSFPIITRLDPNFFLPYGINKGLSQCIIELETLEIVRNKVEQERKELASKYLQKLKKQENKY